MSVWGLSPFKPGVRAAIPIAAPKALEPDKERAEKFERAKTLWRESVSLDGTPGWTYFTTHRGWDISQLSDLSALRWHQGEHAIIARVVDAVTNEFRAVHRIFLNEDGTIQLNADGSKKRWLLGGSGVIKLTPDEDVTYGLHIAEGIEKCIANMLQGCVPMWCAVSAGGIKTFPPLNGIESLTIIADPGKAGEEAAEECRARWEQTGPKKKKPGCTGLLLY